MTIKVITLVKFKIGKSKRVSTMAFLNHQNAYKAVDEMKRNPGYRDVKTCVHIIED